MRPATTRPHRTPGSEQGEEGRGQWIISLPPLSPCSSNGSRTMRQCKMDYTPAGHMEGLETEEEQPCMCMPPTTNLTDTFVFVFSL